MIIIGTGRVGLGLQARAQDVGLEPYMVSRTGGWDVLDRRDGPILIAVRNDALDEVLERVPDERRGDLVFLQNGMIRPWLAARGLEGATRGLLFFAAPKIGMPIQPGGASPFHGPRAFTVVQWFGELGLQAEEVSAERFAEIELEKLIWNSAFGLMCEAHGVPVGTVVERHRAELEQLVSEMVAVGGPPLGVELELAPLVQRLCAYSLSIPGYTGAVKEWPYRNGWFVDEAARQGLATPTHAALLAAVGRG